MFVTKHEDAWCTEPRLHKMEEALFISAALLQVVLKDFGKREFSVFILYSVDMMDLSHGRACMI